MCDAQLHSAINHTHTPARHGTREGGGHRAAHARQVRKASQARFRARAHAVAAMLRRAGIEPGALSAVRPRPTIPTHANVEVALVRMDRANTRGDPAKSRSGNRDYGGYGREISVATFQSALRGVIAECSRHICVL